MSVPTVSSRSQSIADVSVDAAFSPEQITLQHKSAELRVQLCFRAQFRPPRRNSRVGEWGRRRAGGPGSPTGVRPEWNTHLSLQTRETGFYLRAFKWPHGQAPGRVTAGGSVWVSPRRPRRTPERRRAVLSVAQARPSVPCRAPRPSSCIALGSTHRPRRGQQLCVRPGVLWSGCVVRCGNQMSLLATRNP